MLLDSWSSMECGFSEALLASLRRQRSLTSPFCDVHLRCGDVTVPTHACVLAAVSRFFENILISRSSSTNRMDVDVSSLFSGVESYLPDVIDAIYLGRSISAPGRQEKLLKDLYLSLDLKMQLKEHCQKSCSQPQPQPQPCDLILMVADGHEEVVRSSAFRPPKEITMDVSVCPKCDLLFMSKEEFLSHRRLPCTRRLNCQTCGNMFSRVQSLISHLVEVRHGETVCSVCEYVGQSQKDLESHLKRHAEVPDKPYFCLNCDARFSTRKRWLQHLPKHSTEAPFVCATCGKGFKWKHALTAHMIVHTKEKKFLCQECGFSTSHASTFRFHTRLHTGHLMKCDYPDCTFQTTRKSNLVQHKCTHSGEKPHQCEVCGRSFSLAKNMRRHARQHDVSAVNYSCSVPDCSFTSLRSDKYYEHMRKYHTGLMETSSSEADKEPGDAGKTANVLEKSPFNIVSPPNVTVPTAMADGTFSDLPQMLVEPSTELAEGRIIADDDFSEPPLPF